MVPYDPKRWFTVLCSIHGTVVPRIWRRTVLLGMATACLWAWHHCIRELTPLDPLGHSLMGGVLGLLIVLRTNTAIERYW